MGNEPHWTAFLTALLTPTVAVLGSYIAYKQWRLGQDKLRLDLFDRRFRLYDATKTLLFDIATLAKVDDAQVLQHASLVGESKWLFGPEVTNRVEQLYAPARELQNLAYELARTTAAEELLALYAKRSELTTWFMQQYASLDQAFAPYLTVRQ